MYGIQQENIYKSEQNDPFTFTALLLLMQCAFRMVAAVLVLKFAPLALCGAYNDIVQFDSSIAGRLILVNGKKVKIHRFDQISNEYELIDCSTKRSFLLKLNSMVNDISLNL